MIAYAINCGHSYNFKMPRRRRPSGSPPAWYTRRRSMNAGLRRYRPPVDADPAYYRQLVFYRLMNRLIGREAALRQLRRNFTTGRQLGRTMRRIRSGGYRR